jgi:hypothetical protein
MKPVTRGALLGACAALSFAAVAHADETAPPGALPTPPATLVAPATDAPADPVFGNATPLLPARKPAQSLPASNQPGGRLGAPGAYQVMRWAEDWSQPARPGAPLTARMKHIPLGSDNVYLTLGGGLRLYDTNWDHSVLGLKANDSDHPLQSRARLYADLHATQYLRAFIELGDNREYGENFTTGPNVDRVDIMQAFVDVTVPLGQAGQITVRPGRYEMPLGNGKLMGVREGLNMRLSYQGFRATWILPGKISVDAFDVRPINIKPGTFDDGPNHGSTYRGIYVSAPSVLAGFTGDLYFYQVNRATATLYTGTGADTRQNWGARIARKGPHVDMDLEGNLQRGHFAGQVIDAFAVMLDAGYTLPEAAWTPRLGVRANIFSGDGAAHDGKSGTFWAASPRLPLISEAAFFNLSNLMDVYPMVTVKPRRDLAVTVGPDFLWRNTQADGIYLGPAGGSLKAYNGSRSIGTDINIEATWQATKSLQLRLYETWFAPSNGMKMDGGKGGNYFGLLGELRF